MVQTLEAIKDGGGSIRVGATGTIGSLMTRELESVKSAPQTLASSRNKPPTVPVSVPCGANTPKRLQHRKSLDEASSSGSNNSINHRSPEVARKTKSHIHKIHRTPMLGSDNIAFDRTPRREKTDKKGPYIVEIVDLKCRTPDRAWASPITNRLKKLSFSKLSESSV